MKNYTVTIKTTKGEVIDIPIAASNEADAKKQTDTFFNANYKAPDRESYVVKSVTIN